MIFEVCISDECNFCTRKGVPITVLKSEHPDRRMQLGLCAWCLKSVVQFCSAGGMWNSEAALSARDEAGADDAKLVDTLAECAYNDACDGRMTASEATQQAREALIRRLSAVAPPASGEAEAWDSLAIAHLLDERASDRGGDKLLTDAAALIRRLAAVAPAGSTEYGWLIENGKQTPFLRYRTMEQGIPVWTEDHMKALRFCRREDAERFAAEDDEAWSIVEHAWHSLPTPPATAGQE